MHDPHTGRDKTVIKIIKTLNNTYNFRFTKRDPFKTLIYVMLSARTTDEVSFPAAERLLKTAKDLDGILIKLSEKKIQKIIYPVGFYRQKAKRIKQTCKIIREKYRYRVPDTREELMKLPGIGPKSADIVLCYGHGIPSIAIDTHCNRIPKRIGLIPKDATLDEVKVFLEDSTPKDKWYLVNDLLVQFGKDVCRPIKPLCNICPFNSFCDYYKMHCIDYK